MTPTAPLSVIDEFDTTPIARIDTQDEEFIIPLREYLETNSCRVIVNAASSTPAVYLIAVGDLPYVKNIFATQHTGQFRRLGIVFNASVTDAENIANDLTKILVMDPVYLSAQDVTEIFSFFFAGIQNFLNKRRSIHEPSRYENASSASYGAPELPGAEPEKELSSKRSSPVATDSLRDKENSEMLTASDTARIGKIITDVFNDVSGDRTKKSKRKIRGTTKLSELLNILVMLCLISLTPVFWYAGSLLLTSVSFGYATKHMRSQSTTNAAKGASFGTYWLNQSKLALSLIRIPVVFVGGHSAVRNQERLISFLDDISHTFSDAQSIIAESNKIAASFTLDTARSNASSMASSIEHLRITTETAHNRFGLAEAELSAMLGDDLFPFSIPVLHRKAEEALSKLKTMRMSLSYINKVLLLYPGVAGFTQSRTYLVLLQNSNELRPTGGFIGSVGIAKFEDGGMSDFIIQDVYALDGQLKGHVDPPPPIRDLLSQEHWYLRDSNWNPDFKSSAQRAQWFYEKETGERVDGVVAVNVPVIVEILRATGPVQLPDYNDRITAENFFGKSFYYTQNNFFPGSTQKKDFLGSLMRALMTKIMTDKDVNRYELFNAFVASVAKRDIVFMFNQKDAQSLVEHFGWGGRVFADEGCSGVDKQMCTYDPLAISEANVSVSKVNYFVERSAVREITLSQDGAIHETVTLNIKNTANTSPDGDKPGVGGAYRTYIRFLLPQGSMVSDVRIGDRVVPGRKGAGLPLPDLPFIEKSDGPPGTQSIGVALAVLPGMQSKLQISYSPKNTVSFGKGGAILDTLWYKHPGISSMPLSTIIRYPLYWVVTNEKVRPLGLEDSPISAAAEKTNSFVAKDGQLEYNNDVQTDTSIRIKIIK